MQGSQNHVLTIVGRGLHRGLSKGLKGLADDAIERPVHHANLLDKLRKLTTD